ncbi:hypothetical protein LLEC1_05208 [Akanthomyces lecanii]|uniref:Uncharacterized protein n=1 Tax=Cordyceps confragosa TaxID=2714763 RepID=A0A179ICN1_CORDF|nr:hypothetical protein LLEC1_05208 [Akanthomyces lecanii]
MDADVRREAEQDAFQRAKTERERRDEDKTRRNRERREKMKARKAKKGKNGGGGGGGDGTTTDEHGIEPARVVADRRDDDEITGESGNATAAASEPGLVIHDDD